MQILIWRSDTYHTEMQNNTAGIPIMLAVFVMRDHNAEIYVRRVYWNEEKLVFYGYVWKRAQHCI